VKTKKAPSNSSSTQGEFVITRSSLPTKAVRRVDSEVSSIIGCRIPMLVVLLFAISIPAFSQESDSSVSFTPLEKLWSQQTLTGDWGGARTRLAERYGITVNGFWDNQYFGSPDTGNTKVKTGVDNWSRIRGTLDINMEKLAHIRGFSLHITATLNEGADIGSKMGTLIPVLGLDTINHQLRLDSWWAKETLLDNKVSLYAGQISGTDFFGYPDDYFHFTSLGAFYAPFALYNTFESFDPLTTPAAMVEVTPTKHFRYRTMVQSITEGNPSDPHAVLNFYNWYNNPSGTSMQMKDGVLWNNEWAYLWGSGQAQFGFSYSGARAYTQWSGNAGNGTLVETPGFQPDSKAGNENYYVVLKQTVYRPKGGSDRGVDLRGMYVWGPADKGVLPYNRQLVLTAEFNGLLPGRPKDSINFSFDYVGIRAPLQTPTAQSEKAYEWDYVLHVTPWLQWMPDLQVRQDIGANPLNGTGVIIGMRSLITF
jgi:porin